MSGVDESKEEGQIHHAKEERKVMPDEKDPGASTDELARFRREWEAEVKNRGTLKASALEGSSSHFRPVSSNEASRHTARGSSTLPTAQEPDEATETPSNDPLRLMRRAVQTYAQAVESERSGQLDQALTLYRKAFRIDSNVDRLFERASIAIQAEVEQGSDGTLGRREVLIETEEVRSSLYRALNVEDYRYRAMKRKEERDANGTSETKSANAPRTSEESDNRDQLSALINKLSVHTGGERNFDQIGLEPDDEEKPIHIAKLPEEVLLHILSFIAAPRGRRGARIGANTEQQPSLKAVEGDEAAEPEVPEEKQTHRKVVGVGVVLAGPDFMSIEQLGRTCWKFRLLTRAWSVWRLIVRETYFPPQIPLKVPLPSLVQKHSNDWRTTFVEQPRVRLNGAYIAACHYTRPGVHDENVWIRVVHVVEFYRSLRFLPNGQALSLLTTDAPSQTVRKMEPSLKVKGFAIGTWTLHPQGLADDEVYSRPAGPKIIVDDLKDKTMSRYKFRLILKLETTSRGKWNRMEVLEYESVNLESGEVCPLPLNHKKPFHFSTVRSYGI